MRALLVALLLALNLNPALAAGVFGKTSVTATPSRGLTWNCSAKEAVTG